MKNAMQKDFWREIQHTRSRFFSIMILVALSVAFLSGLKATAPDMKKTGDDYLDSLHLADIQVLSTLGLTDDDITAIRAQDKVEDAEGEYVIDAFASSDSLDAVVKVLSLTGRGINEVLLRDGRMPERADECVVEENMLSLMNIAIGDRITLTPGDDLSDALAQDTYTVVGTVRSPVYLAVERGTSTLGSGTVKAYLYLPREAFTLDYYTAAYVRVSGAAEMTAFYSDYDDYIDAVIDELEPFGDARAQLRHDDLVDEATEKLDDAQKELDDAKAEADEKLGDAQKELSDARRKLDDGWKDYYDGQQELKDARVELDDAKIELDDGEMQYLNGMEEYEDALDEYEKGRAEYEDGLAQYEDGVKELESGEKELAAGRSKLESGQQQLNSLAKTVTDALAGTGSPYAGAPGKLLDDLGRGDSAAIAATDAALGGMRAQLSAGIARAQDEIDKMQAQLTEVNGTLSALEQKPTEEMSEEELAAYQAQLAKLQGTKQKLEVGIAEAQAKKAELTQQLAQLQSVSASSIAANKRELDNGWSEYYNGAAELDAGRKELLDAKKQLDDAKAQLNDAPAQLADAKKELSDARKKLDDGWKDYYDGEEQYADGVKELSDAYTELTDGERDYRKGLREYADGKAEADEKIADAQEKITDARRKVADIDSCEWYIFSRSYNPGYTGFGQDADRMANLASVLPIIFFLVAALVCLTTMTRMVEEQRVQIGALKALGYSRLSISRKYIGYGLLPSLVGGVLGLVIGYILFPKMIFTAYQIMYQMPDIELHAYTDISLFSVLAAVACTTVATLWACLATLRETPASLMRPRTPELSSPLAVLELARQEGKLRAVETLTWHTAMGAFAAHCRAGHVPEGCRVFINSLSNQAMLPEDTARFHREYRDYLSRVVLELTEVTRIDADLQAVKTQALMRSGGKLALDDYGSGYNGEAMLLAVQPDYVKIDVAIVRGVDQDDDKRQLVENLVSYAHVRGIALVGEGVETRAELEALAALGVDYVQGYFLARPALLPPPVTPEGAECLRALRGEMD